MKTNRIPGIAPAVSGIDLDRLKAKLAEENGWDDTTIAELDRQYRMYLHLKLVHPDVALVPTQFIDTMWHAHILDTEAYARDTEAVFGSFLHHFPYLGLGGDSEKAKLDDAFQETATLWAAEFGEAYAETPFGSQRRSMMVRLRGALPWGAAARCTGHKCHAPSSCACRAPGSCK